MAYEIIPYRTGYSWWFFTNPSEKYARQIGSFPQFSGWQYKIFETTTQFSLYVQAGDT